MSDFHQTTVVGNASNLEPALSQSRAAGEPISDAPRAVAVDDARAHTQALGQDARLYGQAVGQDARAVGQDVKANAQAAGQETKNAANSTAQQAQQKGQQLANSAQETAKNVQASAQDTAARAQQSAQETARNAQETAKRAQEQAGQKLNQAGTKLNQAAGQANERLHAVGEQVAHHPLVQDATRQTQQQLNVLDQQLARFGFLNEFEARTRIPKTYGVLGFSATTALLILLNLFGLAQPITNLIGWALPAYLTCHALESPQKGDDAQWLCYWIVFGFLNYIESAALRVVLYYIPHYFTIKLAFTVWLMLPQTRGAERVYYSALRPLFQQGKAKAREINANSPATSQFGAGVNSSSSNRFGTTSSGLNNDNSVGYSTGINTRATGAGAHDNNPFTATSAAGGVGSGFEGMMTTEAGSIGRISGVVVPPAAGLPLPENPMGAGARY